MQDLQQCASDQLGMRVGLNEPAGAHARTELGPARVPDRQHRSLIDRPVLDVGITATGRQQSQEVRLPGAVRAEHGHPFAVPDLEVERLHQAGQLEPLADHRTLARSDRP